MRSNAAAKTRESMPVWPGRGEGDASQTCVPCDFVQRQASAVAGSEVAAQSAQSLTHSVCQETNIEGYSSEFEYIIQISKI